MPATTLSFIRGECAVFLLVVDLAVFSAFLKDLSASSKFQFGNRNLRLEFSAFEDVEFVSGNAFENLLLCGQAEASDYSF